MAITHAIICSVVLMLIGGCGRSYLLPGHTQENLSHPPDLVMHVGQSIPAAHNGIMLVAEPPWMCLSSKDPEIVTVEPRGEDSAVLVARAVGSARLNYFNYEPGFTVTVYPKQ